MRVNLFALFGVAAITVLAMPEAQQKPVCRLNACQRAVERRGHFKRARRDCSSFLAQTVTPAVVTVTMTESVASATTQTTTSTSITTTVTTTTSISTNVVSTTTTTVLVPPGIRAREVEGPLTVLQRRQVTQSNSMIPKSASACTGTAEYSSACSCINIHPSTTTLTTPTTTVHTTVTQEITATESSTITSTETYTSTARSTVSVTSTATMLGSLSTETFILRANDPNSQGPYYVQYSTVNYQAIYTANIGSAAQFTLSNNGSWITHGLESQVIDYTADFGATAPIWKDGPYNQGQTQTAISCMLPAPASGNFQCTIFGFDTFGYYSNVMITQSGVAITSNPNSEGITPITLTALPIFIPAT